MPVAIFFVVFIVISGLVVMSLFIGVITTSMVRANRFEFLVAQMRTRCGVCPSWSVRDARFRLKIPKFWQVEATENAKTERKEAKQTSVHTTFSLSAPVMSSSSV